MSEKSAVTLAFSSPERMLSFDALAPQISPTDSMIIDFPGAGFARQNGKASVKGEALLFDYCHIFYIQLPKHTACLP